MLSSRFFCLRLVIWSHHLPREEYNAVRNVINNVDPFLTLTEHEFSMDVANHVVKKSKHAMIDKELRLISGRLERAVCVVDDVERLLGIKTRWQREDAEYQKMVEYISNRKFVRVVEELQGLVVSRLMELDKVNLAGSGTGFYFLVQHDSNTSLGYKLRKHIAQALSRRCAAIRNAIDRYNALAPLQKPPRPFLAYSEVVEYCNFSEFEILKHSDHNLLSKDWALLANRQAAKKYFKIERAKEEIRRCNVEIARLQAWVDADDVDMSRVVAAHEDTDPAFAAHLKVVQTQRRHVNDRLRMRLQQIYSLHGYCGLRPHVATSLPTPTASDSESSFTAPQSLIPTRSSLTTSTASIIIQEDRGDSDESSNGDEPHDDEDEDEMLRMTDVLAKIMV